MSKETIGFVGTGVMGGPMALHLLNAGYSVCVYNRTKAKAEAILEAGGTWMESPGELAAACDIICTMVGYPTDVESTYFGDDGLINRAKTGALFIDFTTSRPDLAVRIAEAAEKAGKASLDAPVSGGDKGAREAKLSIMVGGSESAYQRARPVLEIVGANIVYQGPAGSGQHTKMCNQIAVAASTMGACEALRYAEQSGLDPATVLQSISAGAAGSWSLSNLAPRILKGDFEPGFYVHHFIKDLKIAIESAESMAIELPGLQLALKLYEELAAMGHEQDGTHALMHWYRSKDS
ncbi:NAD(P)-dependent oxidoreductase [Coraliomargarita parva]|uniref:NAD(P)-dependent oxidoreductase n=1 Tax=Coraliomargarita parva TaxID=3014050 RepID=UPI0022B40848|nr:NAD(P)-dependent oxidoreductase [Coraliomargarita parva]